ncbi:MAG: hypothetical protein KC983_10610, partial [Phycisphaerales bacterium]|nr:hypothetical protein [Phycisphaerales bacterium]
MTTVICHGYSLDASKGPWVETMGEAMRDRAIAEGLATGGAVVRYDQASGAWRLESGTLDPDEPVFCVYRWLNDFDKPGPNLGFAEGAADALYAALRDPRFIDGAGQPIAGIALVDDRQLHLLGHSRGAIVNSETVRRFAREGLTIDHVTNMDPHPVNGTLDADPNWGDPTPVRWANVTFEDTYWRADGAFLLNAFDFDGIPIPTAFNTELNESALNSGGYSFAHSDTHLWYHGTIDLSPTPSDGEQTITASMRSSWWPEGYTQRGYYYARLGGGSAFRPTLTAGTPVVNPSVIYNGTFDGGAQAGWLFHGGSLNASIVSDAGDFVLRTSAGNSSAVHNRLFLPAGSSALAYDVRVTTGNANDQLELVLLDAANTETVLAVIDANASTGWMRDLEATIPGSVPRNAQYRLIVRLVSTDAIGATVDVDNLGIIEGTLCPADCAPPGGNGSVNIDDLLAVINAF